MTVTLKTRMINQLTQKVTLLNSQYKESESGERELTYIELGEVWARIQPICGFQRRRIEEDNPLQIRKILGTYKVAMRKMTNSNARHAEMNALRWKYKILDILLTLQLSEDGQWLEGVAVEYGKEG